MSQSGILSFISIRETRIQKNGCLLVFHPEQMEGTRIASLLVTLHGGDTERLGD